MRELERDLRDLAVRWPATPDLAAAVAERLAREPQARRWRLAAPPAWWRGPAPAWAASLLLVLVLGAGMAVPPARSAILELLGLRGAQIERRAPDAPPAARQGTLGSALDLGRRVSEAEAGRAAGFRPAPPSDRALGAADAVWFAPGPMAGGRVSYVYAEREGIPPAEQTGVAVLVTEFVATVERFIEKAAGPGTEIDRFTVDGQPAFFLSGTPHGFAYVDRRGNGAFEDQRLAAPTLLVERNGLLIRVEGRMSRDRAVAIARSIDAGTRRP